MTKEVFTKEVMTIEVERKDKNDEFNITDLKYFHRDCQGGSIKLARIPETALQLPGYSFTCKRCDASQKISDDDTPKVGIINVSINGTEYIAQSNKWYILLRFVPRNI